MAVAAMATTATLRASDHADPIDLIGNKPLEGGITDLFFFPDGDHVAIILCVRRGLTQTASLQLLPYTYRIHLDLHSTISRDDDESNKRYGGKILNPAGISSGPHDRVPADERRDGQRRATPHRLLRLTAHPAVVRPDR